MSINIFYYEKCTFEYDYFRNIIFKDEKYDCKINWINYNDDNLNIFTEYTGKVNILITNPLITKNYLIIIQNILNPKIIFFLSDSMMKFKDYYNEFKCPYFHQHNLYDFYGDNLQIPLGYVSGYMDKKIDIDLDTIIDNKIYDFSFVGEIKRDRELMINTFKEHFFKKYISIGKTDWSNIENNKIKPCDIYKIYQKSFFIPIGRGNYSYDCFRFYEAIMSNSIPVLVGDIDKINRAYDFDGIKPIYIVSNTWESACELCKKMMNDGEMIKTILNYNNIWWEKINNRIIDRINKLILI